MSGPMNGGGAHIRDYLLGMAVVLGVAAVFFGAAGFAMLWHLSQLP